MPTIPINVNFHCRICVIIVHVGKINFYKWLLFLSAREFLQMSLMPYPFFKNTFRAFAEAKSSFCLRQEFKDYKCQISEF